MTTRKSKKAGPEKTRARKRTKRARRLTTEEVEVKEVSSVGAARTDDLVTAGPRKKRVSGVPEARLSYHKARSAWFQSRTTWPVREAPVHKLVQERTRAGKALATPTAIAAQWESA